MKKPPKGPSVQSYNGGFSRLIGFLYSQAVNPAQLASTTTATAATVMSPLARRLAIFVLSSMKAIQMAPSICMILNISELRERVRMLK